jgi:hypothetical protein
MMYFLVLGLGILCSLTLHRFRFYHFQGHLVLLLGKSVGIQLVGTYIGSINVNNEYT